MNDIQALLQSDKFKLSIQQRQALSPEDAAKFVSMFESAVRKNQKLLTCSPKSIELAAHKLADLGLTPVDTFNQIYLYHRWNDTVKSNECVIDVGWRGYATLAYKLCGTSIESDVVFEDEGFQCEKGTTTILSHRVNIFADRSEGKVVAAYAKATLPSGMVKYEIMTKLQIEVIKKISIEKNKKLTPAWVNFYTEMARKSVVKRLCKQLNELEKINSIIELENEEDYFESEPIDTSKTAAQRLTDRIKSNIQSKSSAAPAISHEERATLDASWREFEEGEELLPVRPEHEDCVVVL
ncbi:recombinase RecT [Nitrospira sp. BLG_2]|uniref:recombinase RecT n=1 Tax=Nitrospira sp. BLG_2 TaxID=3397507 RepID=UPI003B9B71E8